MFLRDNRIWVPQNSINLTSMLIIKVLRNGTQPLLLHLLESLKTQLRQYFCPLVLCRYIFMIGIWCWKNLTNGFHRKGKLITKLNWFPGNAPCHEALSYGTPFGGLVLLQKKNKGTLRLCNHYWSFNMVTVKNKYPILLFADFLIGRGRQNCSRKFTCTIFWLPKETTQR